MALDWAASGAVEVDREALIDVCVAVLRTAVRESRKTAVAGAPGSG
jgi:hypothetical protein